MPKEDSIKKKEGNKEKKQAKDLATYEKECNFATLSRKKRN